MNSEKRNPELSIIVVSYNTKDVLRKALTKVYTQDKYNNFELIVVDNASHDGSADMVEQEFPQAKTVRSPVNGGFAAGNNLGLKYANGEYVLLLNSDAYVFDDSLKDSVDYMNANPNVGIMGPQLVGEDGHPQMSAQQFPNPWLKFKVMTGIDARYPSYETFYDSKSARENSQPEPRKVDWVPGTYFLIRRAVIEQIGGLDELFFMYFEEVDYCRMAKKEGWDVVFNPRVTCIHLGGASALSTTRKVSKSGRQLVDIRVTSEYDYYKKHSGVLTAMTGSLLEIFWKSVIIYKNKLLKDQKSDLKIGEAALARELVWVKLKKEIFSRR